VAWGMERMARWEPRMKPSWTRVNCTWRTGKYTKGQLAHPHPATLSRTNSRCPPPVANVVYLRWNICFAKLHFHSRAGVNFYHSLEICIRTWQFESFKGFCKNIGRDNQFNSRNIKVLNKNLFTNRRLF